MKDIRFHFQITYKYGQSILPILGENLLSDLIRLLWRETYFNGRIRRSWENYHTVLTQTG